MAIFQQGQVIEGVVTEDMRSEYCAAPAASPSHASDLPAAPPVPKRWVPHRKAEVIAAVDRGELTLEQACARYAISIEEFVCWVQNISVFGLAGLQVNGTQRRRKLRSRSDPSGQV